MKMYERLETLERLGNKKKKNSWRMKEFRRRRRKLYLGSKHKIPSKVSIDLSMELCVHIPHSKTVKKCLSENASNHFINILSKRNLI